MPLPKRPRLEAGTTNAQVIPLINTPSPSVGIATGNQSIMNQIPAATGSQTPILTPSLQGMPIELLTHITHYLPALDIVRLGQTARHFRAELAVSSHGSSLWHRSLDLVRYRDVYDEDTQTLDLCNILRNIQAPLSGEAYRRRLEQTISMLQRHRQWAQSHIKALVIPLETLYQWPLRDLLLRMFLLVGSVEHLRLAMPPNRQPVSSALAATLLHNLEAFKTLPAKKVTIASSSGALTLRAALHLVFVKKFLHPALESLAFDIRSSEKSHDSVNIPDNTAYPALTTLKLRLSETYLTSLGNLPATVTRLYIDGNIMLEDQVTSITRLEIPIRQLSWILRESNIPGLLKALPAIKEIHIKTSDHSYDHSGILSTLKKLPFLDISYSFSSRRLHVHQIGSLVRLLSTGNVVHLPHEILFYAGARTDIRHFGELAGEGVFRHVTDIQYLFDSIHAPAESAIRELADLLHAGVLPRLRNFSFEYEFPPRTIEINDDEQAIAFPETPEGKLLLFRSVESVPLNQLVPDIDFRVFLTPFIEIESKVREYLQEDEIENEREALFFTQVNGALLEYVTAQQHLTQESYTCREWLAHLESLHLQLYGIYLQRLRETGINPQVLRDAYEEILPQSFSATDLGQQIHSRITDRLLSQYGLQVLRALKAPLAAAGLGNSSAQLTKNGFRFRFVREQHPALPVWQQDSVEMLLE